LKGCIWQVDFMVEYETNYPMIDHNL